MPRSLFEFGEMKMKLKSEIYPELDRFLSLKSYAELIGLTPKAIHTRLYRGTQKGVVRENGRVLIDVDTALTREDDPKAASSSLSRGELS